MLRYICKRVVGVIPTLIIVVTFVFFFVRLIPGDPARQVAGPQATKEDVELVREQLGPSPAVYQLRDRTCEGGFGHIAENQAPGAD